jgi:copper chaperone NosL
MKIRTGFGFLLLFFLSGCISQDPVEIHLHSEECAHCKMVISDRQFASQMVSEKGKAYLFDAVECLVAFTIQNPEMAKTAAIYLPDYSDPGSWILLDNAVINRSPEVKSPMGLSLFVLSQNDTATDLYEDTRQLTWDETLQLVKNEWNVQ